MPRGTLIISRPLPSYYRRVTMLKSAAIPPPLPVFIANRGTTTTNSLAILNPTLIAVGSLLVLAGYNSANTALTNLADSKGNPWTILQQLPHTTSGRRLYLAVCRVDTAYVAGNTITWSGPAGTRIFSIAEFGAVRLTGTYLDGAAPHSVGAQSGVNTQTVTSGSMTSVADRTLWIGAVGWTFGATTTPQAPAGPPDYKPIWIWANGNERICICWRNAATVITTDLFWDHAAVNVANAVAAEGVVMAAI